LKAVDQRCPDLLREAALEILIDRKTALAIDHCASTESNEDCLKESKESLHRVARKMLEWADSGADLGNLGPLLPLMPPPSFSDFEQSTYASICNALSSNAKNYQPDWTEGSLWSQSEAEREAFVVMLGMADRISFATGESSWVSALTELCLLFKMLSPDLFLMS
jgi:hypothetical protein